VPFGVSFSLLRQRPVPSGRRLLEAVSVGVNRSFEPFSRISGSSGSRRKSRRCELWSRSSVCVAAPSVDARVMSISIRKSRTYAPFSRFDLPAPEREAAIYEGAGSESIAVFKKLSKCPATDWTPPRPRPGAARLPWHMG
jgi:hypothetical protein